MSLDKDPILISTIICPGCEHQQGETMSTKSCQYFWDCPQCKKTFKPLDGDCCVYCSYGDNPCPPIQCC